MYSGGEEPEIIMTVMPFSILIMLIPLVAVVAIFLYKNRKVQMKMVVALMLLIIAVIALAVYYVYSVINTYDSELMFGYKLVLPVLMLIFSILAYRRIKKDEELVRSYDRLR
jgi:peptidoglycan/LPS O-acetylase OafA/YrhL